jgi:hypothetical protein
VRDAGEEDLHNA